MCFSYVAGFWIWVTIDAANWLIALFSQVVFLSAIVGSDVAVAAGQAAISAQSQVDISASETDSSINISKEEGTSSAL